MGMVGESVRSEQAAERRPLIVGIGGTPRPFSSSERALAISLAAARAEGAETLAFAGADLILPMYSPGTADRTPEAQRLIDAFRRCDGMIIAAPSYHGSLSGLLKNALDYAEDLRRGRRSRHCARSHTRCAVCPRPLERCSTRRARCSTRTADASISR